MASNSPAAYLLSRSAQTLSLSLSPLSRRPSLSSHAHLSLSLSSHAHLSLSSRRLIIANGSSKNGRRSNGGANNNNGGRSGGNGKVGGGNGNGNGGEGNENGGGGGDGGRNRNSLPVPSFYPSDQLYSDPSLIEYFDKHHTDITKGCIIGMVYLFGFMGIFRLFLYLIGYYDYCEKKKLEEGYARGNGY